MQFLGYFSIAITKCHNQSQLIKDSMYLGTHGSGRLAFIAIMENSRAPGMLEHCQAQLWTVVESLHLIYNDKTERANWQCHGLLRSQLPVPSDILPTIRSQILILPTQSHQLNNKYANITSYSGHS